MNKIRAQQIWDHELLSAWDGKGSKRMGHVVGKFLSRAGFGQHPLDSKSEHYERVNEFLGSFNLRRCLDIDHYGNHVFRAYKSDVIGFIQGRCHKMSHDLISGVPPLLIIASIGDYKWRKLKSGSKSRSDINAFARGRKENKGTKFISARSLTKTQDWDVVK